MGNGDITDPRALDEENARLEAKAKLLRERETSDLIWLMRDKRGRRFVSSLLERAGVFQTSFDPNALTMARKTGWREIGLRVLDEVQGKCFDMFVLMLKERLEDE